MRGKLEVKEFKSTATRIIPAHAGQTSTLGMTVVRPSDHPRACGANFATLVGSQLQNGSSPRMRGKRGLRVKMCVWLGVSRGLDLAFLNAD